MVKTIAKLGETGAPITLLWQMQPIKRALIDAFEGEIADRNLWRIEVRSKEVGPLFVADIPARVLDDGAVIIGALNLSDVEDHAVYVRQDIAAGLLAHVLEYQGREGLWRGPLPNAVL